MFVRLRRDERGVAMVVALGVAFVVMLLATVIFTQAIHNSNESAYGRRRLTAVSAAEAGLNYWYNYLQNTSPTSISSAAVTRSLGSSPATSSFTATPIFYSDTAGTNVFTGTITSSS
jgi:Tfp pilus assembly protein PilX